MLPRSRMVAWTFLKVRKHETRQSSIGFHHKVTSTSDFLTPTVTWSVRCHLPGSTTWGTEPFRISHQGSSPKSQVTLMFDRNESPENSLGWRSYVWYQKESCNSHISRDPACKATVLEKLPKWFTFFSKKLMWKWSLVGRFFSLSANLKLVVGFFLNCLF